jgi:hypothetical protein
MTDEILVRDMAITAAELRRSLHSAFPGNVSEQEGRYRIVFAGATLGIDAKPLPPRIIALLELPRLEVRLRFTAGTPGQRGLLLERMDRALQRGGG